LNTLYHEEENILNFNGEHESDEYNWFELTNLPDKTLDKKQDIIEITNKAKKMFKDK
jgi:hypothetical protein